MTPQVLVRPAAAADMETIAHLKSLAFGGDDVIIEADQTGRRCAVETIIVAEAAGEVVGTACAFPTQMWLSGVPVSMGAVADVTTHPDYRRQGIFQMMMEYLLQRMAGQKLAVSALFPAAHPLYHRFEYAAAATCHAYGINPQNLTVLSERSRVRPFAETDLPALQSIYRGGQLSRADGRLTRSAERWRVIINATLRRKDTHIVVYDDGGVSGYLRYTLTADGALQVAEMFVAADAAYRGLWGYLAAQPVAAIDYIAPADDPIFQMLTVPADRYGGNRGWCFDDVFHVTAGFMLRIIDLPAALTARFYPHDMMGRYVLKIHDPRLPGNQAPLAFRLVDGRPEVRPAQAGQTPHLETDIATFAQVYCGFLSPEQARRLGRLQADDDTIAWLGKAMALKPLYIHQGDWF